ncbi:MAG: hypothetical protein IPO00_17235 [Betaproteobacteria bacterium]|nr:hypothetical protein [Betaproteobacteria bacterium]
MSAEATTIETGSGSPWPAGVTRGSHPGGGCSRCRRPPDRLRATPSDLAARAGIAQRDLDALAQAGALKGPRRTSSSGRMESRGAAVQLDLLAAATGGATPGTRHAPSEAEDLVADYASTGLARSATAIRSACAKRLTTRRFALRRSSWPNSG